VLPFINLSGDLAQDYLADVITEGLTAYLSRIRDSFVIARTTAFTYKEKAVDVKEIGRALGVRYILEGSAQQFGTRLRVSAQLVNADSGAHLWADQFDADRADLLQMQDAIVTRLARALEIELAAAEAARISRTRPASLDAEDMAVRGEAIFLAHGMYPRERCAVPKSRYAGMKPGFNLRLRCAAATASSGRACASRSRALE